MNFSALNTHAIGVIVPASAGVVVEGAASFSGGASASAQATLHSHATATAINSVALTTTQSVVRFATAIAILGCSAAANVDGYRVQFSNAEIACTASSDANAVVQRQAVVYVTAQATNVAVGSRVAYASASLQAECNLTANSGRVAFAQSTMDTSAALSASAFVSTIFYSIAAIAASATSSATASTISNTSGDITASAVVTSSAYYTKFTSASIVGACSVVSDSVLQATVQCTVAAQAQLTSSAYISGSSTAEVVASSELVSSTYVILDASGVFTGSSLAISVGEKKAVAQTTLVASAALTAAATVGVFSSAQVTASSSLSRSDTQTFVVTASGGNYVIASQSNRPLDFKVGSTYTFDLSSSSNGSHPLRFSTTNNGTHGGGSEYTTGVTITGYQGQAGSSISIVVTEDTPSTLYYYCAYHSGMGGTVSVSSADDVSSSINSFASAAVNVNAAMFVLDYVERFSVAAVTCNSALVAQPVTIAVVTAEVDCVSAIGSNGYILSGAEGSILCSSTIETSASVEFDVSSTVNADSSCTAEGYNLSIATASCAGTGSLVSEAGVQAYTQADISAQANVLANSGMVHDVEAYISGLSIAISVAEKIAVSHTHLACTAGVSAESYSESVASVSIAGNATVSSSAIIATIVPATASISDTGYMTDAVHHPEEVTDGYWTVEQASWVFQNTSHVRTGPNGANSGNYVSGLWWWNTAGTSTGSGETTSEWRLKPRQSWQDPYWAVDPGPVYLYYVERYVVSSPSVWVAPVVTQAAYTTPAFWTDTGTGPNAQVVVSNVAVLGGSFAYLTGSANVTAASALLPIFAEGVVGSAVVAANAVTQLYTSATVNAVASATATAVRATMAEAHVSPTGYVTPASSVDITTWSNIAGAWVFKSNANDYSRWYQIPNAPSSDYAVTSSSNYPITSQGLRLGSSYAYSNYYEPENSTTYTGYSYYIEEPTVTTQAIPEYFTITEIGPSAEVTAESYIFNHKVFAEASITATSSMSAFGTNKQYISAVAFVSDTGYWTSGYWTDATYAWVSAGVTITWMNGSWVSGNYFSYPYRDSGFLDTWTQNGNTFVRHTVQQHVITVASVYVPAVWTDTGTGPLAAVTASGSVLPYGTADLECLANLTSQCNVARSTTANIFASAGLDALATKYDLADGLFAASADVTVADPIVSKLGILSFAASSDVTAECHVESWRSVEVVSTANIISSPVATRWANAALGANAELSSQPTKFTAVSATATAAAAAAISTLPPSVIKLSSASINAFAQMEEQASAHAYTSADIVCLSQFASEPYVARTIPAVTLEGTADFNVEFTIVVQEGTRSNGIHILVEAESRVIAVEDIDRSTLVELDARIVYAEAA